MLSDRNLIEQVYFCTVKVSIRSFLTLILGRNWHIFNPELLTPNLLTEPLKRGIFTTFFDTIFVEFRASEPLKCGTFYHVLTVHRVSKNTQNVVLFATF